MGRDVVSRRDETSPLDACCGRSLTAAATRYLLYSYFTTAALRSTARLRLLLYVSACCGRSLTAAATRCLWFLHLRHAGAIYF